MKLLIAGDFVINQPYNTSQIGKEVEALFAQSDYNIVNLEAPVTTGNSKILKTGPHLKADKSSTLEVLKALNINVCTLANNHVLDFDEQGVLDTLNFCEEHGIQTVGAGMNREEAAKILYIDTDVGKIAILNFAENEWASATDVTAGANGMDLIDNVKQIQEAKQLSEVVVVIVHGGHEYYNLPSPRIQKQYRFYIENGADLVVGHHPHCISGYEQYLGKSIYYSLGNFLFTKESKFDDWYSGMVLQIEIKDGNINTSAIYVNQQKSNFYLSIVSGEDRNRLEEEFDICSSLVSSLTELDRSWKEFIMTKTEIYSKYWSPASFVRNKYLKYLFNRTGIFRVNKSAATLFLNLIRCEAHADLSKSVLRKFIK